MDDEDGGTLEQVAKSSGGARHVRDIFVNCNVTFWKFVCMFKKIGGKSLLLIKSYSDQFQVLYAYDGTCQCS